MSKVEFNEAFEQRARVTAIEVLLAGMIELHPNPSALRAVVDKLVSDGEAEYNAVSRALSPGSRPDALNVAGGFFATVRDNVDAIMTGHLGRL
jgi:hypothetical protein